MTARTRNRQKIPAQGDIYRVRLNPVEGHEMQGEDRPVLVLSPEAFNQHNPPICCPITQGGDYSRLQGFAVTLLGTGCRTQGAVITSHVRTLDLVHRGATFVEKVPDVVIQEAVMKLQGIIDY